MIVGGNLDDHGLGGVLVEMFHILNKFYCVNI